ncbi:leucine-rich repeat and coiled-coil domain-containing protein 1-like isoform X2 [Biomphalaria glabrata]|uniref:Leucine-rich repeat and coiled-coil domain-containing protein 1-like isoform X2 n=1 Tax=Biomphalaria glabrata TaxID=6526 RepID=A0A9W3AWJ6_BIOGL|nr:leucine-rich repeat and coiled-coil domain-containing protein 1-like isoform X2 [Biomphalaria glabrata]
MTPQGDIKHLSLIDSGVSNIWSLSLASDLESLNLHGNHIHHISNLSHLTNLVHLDLSANQISIIDGLETLVGLKTLNLSCNLITEVSGLSGLRSLESLNLSYNQIESIKGLHCFCAASFHLNYLALHGNKLKNIQDVIRSVQGIRTLHHLVLRQDGSGNPLCHIQGYERNIWSNVHQLQTLNGLDKSGKFNSNLDSVSNIPGLASCLDILLSSSQDQSSQASSPALFITPKIDAVIEQFKQKLAMAQDSSSSMDHSLVKSSVSSPQTDNSYSKSTRRKDNAGHVSTAKGKKTSFQTHPAYSSDPDESDPVHDQPTKYDLATNEMIRPKGATSAATSRRRGQTPASVKKFVQGLSTTDGADVKRKGQSSSQRVTSRIDNHDTSDQRGRDEAEAVYKDLLASLETEKERRWQAEQAARKMAELLKKAQARGQESEAMKSSAIEATSQLKQAVMNEHEANVVLKEEIFALQRDVSQLKEQLEEAKRAEEKSREALKQAETTMARQEADEMSERVHQKSQLQEAQHRASAMSREVQVLRHSLEATKLQLQQLQETLAARENAHREELRTRYKLNSPDLQQIIQEKVKNAERSFQAEQTKQQERVEQLTLQYTDLENEFRYALQLEETRMKELVKEQKCRLAELAKSKQEQSMCYKERLQDLESELADTRKVAAQVEILKQNKSKLQATIQAQESVIEGLKAERKLWGQELAQQGATLSQDRGRLEAKIETLSSEVTSLKKQLEREVDTVKIKTKLIEDQTETIRKLKEAVVERDETIRATREENLKIHRSLEDQLIEVKSSLEETRDLLDRATIRKDELKEQVANLQHELKEERENHSLLSARWKEKGELIGQLETRVIKMKDTWGQKESDLTRDRDTALEQAKQAIEKLKSADNIFRQQLDLKEAAYQEKITQLELEKERELELANQKVVLVEEEMRELLRETEMNKRAMEAKLKKFTQALGDLQTDFL